METLKPRDTEELTTAISGALEDRDTSFEVLGHGSKRGLGRPLYTSHRLDLSEFSQIKVYEPEEMVLSVGAATPLHEIDKVILAKGQRLPFEPPDFGPLFGFAEDEGTIGGAVACNLAGPRRIQAGAARDHLLGFKAVNGRAEVFSSGGRVVKNVTGFDLCKLMSGSFGTLAVLTDVILRTTPRANANGSLIVHGVSPETALSAMTKVLGSVSAVTGAAYVPAQLIASATSSRFSTSDGVLAIRLESQGSSLVDRASSLSAMLREFGNAEFIEEETAKELWRDIRDARFFVGQSSQVWQLSVAPSEGLTVAQEICDQSDGTYYLDCGGGLVWLALEPTPDASQGVVRRAAKRVGGKARLIRASEDVRRVTDIVDPLPEALLAVTERLRASFDPNNILNPGRLRVVKGMK